MADQHHCRWISEPKRLAFLGWVNGLELHDLPRFTTFDSVRQSGCLLRVAALLSSSNNDPATDQHVPEKSVLITLLSDYYGPSYLTAINLEVVTGDDEQKMCSCELKYHTAKVCALLLNIALNNSDPRHVHICMELSYEGQKEIEKTFMFLATEAGGRSAPSEMDWRSFLYTPVVDHQHTPIPPRRSIHPQKIIVDEVLTEMSALNSSFGSDHVASSNNLSFQETSSSCSPVIQGKSSPLVRNTAKLRHKEVEIQKLKRELAEKTNYLDSQADELAELKKRLEAAECQIESMRITERDLRATLWNVQSNEELLVKELTDARDAKRQVETLSSELEKSLVDKQLFNGLEKERDGLFAELDMVTRERDDLERKLHIAETRAQRSLERLEETKEDQKDSFESLVRKKDSLVAENKQLRDEADELRCQLEMLMKSKNDCGILRERMNKLLEDFEKERCNLNEKINAMGMELSTITMERDLLRNSENDCSILRQRMDELTERYEKERRDWNEKVKTLETEVSKITMEKDHLRTSMDAMKQNESNCLPAKRARRSSSRSAVSTTTVGCGDGTGSMISGHLSSGRQSRFDACGEDEDVAMLENPMEPGDGTIRETFIPAQRCGTGATPAPNGHSISAVIEAVSSGRVFKPPFPPQDDVARTLTFQDGQSQQEEEWSDSSVISKMTEKEHYSTPQDKRLSTLNQRNKLQPPHLKSSYPAETQTLPADVKDEDLKNASEYQPPPSVMAAKNTTDDGQKKTGAIARGKAARNSIMSKFRGNAEPKVAKSPTKQAKGKESTKSTPKSTQDELPPNAKGTKSSVAYGIPNTPPGRKTRQKTLIPQRSKGDTVQSVTNIVLRKKI